MLQLFKVRPPLTTGQRVNLDLLMRRSIEAVGSERVKTCSMVGGLDDLAVETGSPQRLLETTRSAILDRLPRSQVSFELRISKDLADDLPSSYEWAGTDSPGLIQVHVDLLEDPLRTVVEIANQCASHFWHTSGMLARDQIHPNLTDLLPVCCGMGALVSDAAFYDSQSSDVGWQRWSMSRSGYYNATEIGYASALLARCRGESDPQWLRRMRLDSRETAKQAFRYFADSDRRQRPILFDADRVPHSSLQATELAKWMVGDDPTFALAAGFALEKQQAVSPRVTDAALSAARGSNLELVPVAIGILGRSRDCGDEVRQLVDRKIASRNQVISIAALLAAAELGYPMTLYRQRIANHFQAFSEGTASLVDVVAAGGSDFESLESLIAQHLGEAILYANDSAAADLADCLIRISRQPEVIIEREIRDQELLPQVLAEIGKRPA